MSFSWWFSKKIALGKNTKNNLSSIIIRIGQVAVALGLIVSLIIISTGVGVQAIANKSGVIRTKENFSGVVFKGVGTDYDTVRFEKFLVKGHFPKVNKDSIVDEVLLSQKIANELKLDVDSSFVMYFIQEDTNPI